jgi:hypothetical protein
MCAGFAATILAGCGGGSSSSAPNSTPAATTAAQSSASTTPATPVAHLAVLSPHHGQSTGSTVTIRVSLHGGAPGGDARLRYVLDGRITRIGGSRLTFHGLAPGRHRLRVLLSPGTQAEASTTFTVRAPAPAPAPVEAPPPQPESPPPASGAPPASGGIPQNGGGDGDEDNSGGPSDGDGNI